MGRRLSIILLFALSGCVSDHRFMRERFYIAECISQLTMKVGNRDGYIKKMSEQIESLMKRIAVLESKEPQ